MKVLLLSILLTIGVTYFTAVGVQYLIDKFH
jgi:hypothetical protein